MSLIFTPSRIGGMKLPNRLVRSATAEYMVDSNGRPRIVRAVRAVFRDYTAFDDIDCLNALLDCPNTYWHNYLLLC